MGLTSRVPRLLARLGFLLAVLAGAPVAVLPMAVPAAAQSGVKTIALKDGSSVAYREAGSGPRTIILVHGWSFDHRLWDKVIDRFPPGHRVIAYDLRGFGQSSKPASGYDFPGFVSDLAGLMEALRIEKAVLSGHSLGSFFIQDFAARYPEKVEALILTAPQPRTTALQLSDPLKAFVQRLDSLPKQDANGPEWRAFFAQNSPRYFMPENLASGDVERFVAQNVLAHPAALVEGFRVAFEAPALAKDHAGTRLPTLVVYGTHDIVPFPAVRQIATDYTASCVAVIERAGHTPPWEKPDAWLARVTGFIARLGEAGQGACR